MNYHQRESGLWVPRGLQKPEAALQQAMVFGGAATDPSFASVILLLHGDGANNSTTFTDSSSLAQTMTPQGAAKLSTAQVKYGTASMFFDGTNDYVKAALATNFHNFLTGDFAVEAWIYPLAVSVKNRFVFCVSDDNIGGFCYSYLGVLSNGVLRAYVQTSTGGGGTVADSSVGLVTTGSWQFVGMYRQGTTMKVRHQNVEVATSSSWANYGNALLNHVAVGGVANGYTDGSVGRWDGYIDDLRVSKNYRNGGTAGPPAAAWPNS